MNEKKVEVVFTGQIKFGVNRFDLPSLLRHCRVMFCNIEAKNEGKSNRFIPNLICPINANSPVFIIHVEYTHTF